jgi:hypothetical protein
VFIDERPLNRAAVDRFEIIGAQAPHCLLRRVRFASGPRFHAVSGDWRTPLIAKRLAPLFNC